jgi:hypothetical protein
MSKETMLGIEPQRSSNGARHSVTLRERIVSVVYRHVAERASLTGIK